MFGGNGIFSIATFRPSGLAASVVTITGSESGTTESGIIVSEWGAGEEFSTMF
jgi:hypothetical protein